jgi:hypothetical protein
MYRLAQGQLNSELEVTLLLSGYNQKLPAQKPGGLYKFQFQSREVL